MNATTTVCGVLLAAGLAAACSKVEGEEVKPPQPVRAAAVSEAPAPSGVRYSATIEPYEQVSLAFKTSGYVDHVLMRKGADGRMRTAQPGDTVARGALLARIRETDARERVAQGRSRLAESDASWTKARLDLERALTLFGADSLIKPDLDAAQAAFDGAQARVQSAKADLELAESALRDCLLVAPSSGVVLERAVDLGSLASPGAVSFVIGDVGSVKARFGIPDSAIASIHLGDVIGVMVEAMGVETFAGRLTAIAPAADPQSRVFDVEVTIPNASGRLRPGMIGTVEIGQGASTAAATRPLTVPLTAIVRAQDGVGQFAVFVVESHGAGAIARARKVQLGGVLGNGIAVRDGLASGETVVVSGATLLIDGAEIKVIE
jgi:multidrug efflux system membrane fusion protein